ncbi:molybdenum cofactor biosynthesis F family protein [Agrococcus sp. ARC_14]|uniref:molybdenum cofactor biosynthesis F family protein n=1 Tax=Agrococcus sp. ARC_14 TaxID=2919927 RepID=UPI001F05E692|nr:molybdenum cofactor biosynthesis F family protein [Agrococcus sp. ARC_14]MCH1882486.1 molybdenum cofactor biosynthesis F family protein [Agrococcus sp. ARC_14]
MSEFISVGDLGRGMEVHGDVLPGVDSLAGRVLELEGERVAFGDDGTADLGGARGSVHVTSIRPGVLLARQLSGDRGFELLVLADGGFTRVSVLLPDAATARESAWTRVQRGDEPTGVRAVFRHGELEEGGRVHAPTRELVGMRNRYTYSPTESYEHIYLSEHRYTWHCLSGVEAGLADTDACDAIRVADGLVLFVWREKIVPTLGAVLIDLQELRTDGAIFGDDAFEAGRATAFPVGSRFEIANTTSYLVEGPQG